MVDEDGRGRPLTSVPADPTVGLAMDVSTFAQLAGGRRTDATEAVTLTGDADLGRRVLAAMAVTP